MLSGAPDATVECLARFGERIGVAFQLSDDLLDVASDSTASGKTPGTDLREGVRTLPVLLALRGVDAEAAPLRELLAGDLTNDDDHAAALAGLRGHPALAEARGILTDWAAQARAALAPLPPGPARMALESVCDAVVSRTG
jgi:heptaprenyl diphosphate synthase